MAGDGEPGAHSCFSTVVVGEHQPVDDGDEQGLDVKLGFVILVVGKMGGDGDDGGGGLAVQEAAEQSERASKAVRCASVMLVAGMAVVSVARVRR